MNIRRILFTLLVSLFLVPSVAWGDDMVFDDDDMVFDEDDMVFDDDDMVFAPDDGTDPGSAQQTGFDVGVVTVPGGALSEAQRDSLQRVVLEAVRQIPNINVYGDTDLLPTLVDREADYCSREPLCLAAVGRAGSVQRIVQARVERTDSGLRLDMDYFDVRDRIFVSYHSRSGLANMDSVYEAVPAGVNDLFGVRSRRAGDDGFDEPDINVTRVMAFTTAGLSAVGLASGIFFGARFNTLEGELEEFARDSDGRYTDLTQVEARRRQNELQSTALTANVSFGLAAGLAATSILLFVLDGGSDDAQASNESSLRRVEMGPTVDRDGIGFGARLRF